MRMIDVLMVHAGRYTFGCVPHWSDAWVPGTWDIVITAYVKGLITEEEYMVLRNADERLKSVSHHTKESND